MLEQEEKHYFNKLVALEDCVPQNIINIKRRRKQESYKKLYELRIKEHKLIDEAKEFFTEYGPADIVKILGAGNSKDNPKEYRREYQRVKVFFRSLYTDVKTVRTVERCKYYLNLIKK